MNKIVLACSAVVGASLYLVYAVSVALFLQHLDLSSISLLELLIVAIQVVKVAGVVARYGLRPARVEVMLVLFSLETIVVLGLIVTYSVSLTPLFSNLANTVFSTWVAALLLVLPSYLIAIAALQMTRDRSLITVLLSLTVGFGFLAFAASAMFVFTGTFTFANFFVFLVGAARLDVASGTIPALFTLYILIPSAAMYCSMLIYATIPTSTSVVPPRITFVLPLLAATATFVWVYAGVQVAPNTLLSFTVPGIVVVALLWAYMRR